MTTKGKLFDTEPTLSLSEGDFRPDVLAPTTEHRLCQYFMPEWAAALVVERFFGDLSKGQHVVEPGCGRGPFLKAIPPEVAALGVELDPRLAAEGRQNTSRQIVTGDFLTVELPEEFRTLDAVIGNPPFPIETVRSFLRRSRALLREEGRAGFVLPAHTFQLSGTVAGFSREWSLRVEMMPRNLFPKLSVPLVFAIFQKNYHRRMVGLSLYVEQEEVQEMTPGAKAVMVHGRPRRSVWAAVVEAALEHYGGEANVQQVYEYVSPQRPTESRTWQDKVRQTLQRVAVAVERGRWRLREDFAEAAVA
jgi:hypothetical protein